MTSSEPQTGFDAAEPKAGFIAAFGLATIVVLVAVIFAIQAYYDHVTEEQIYVKVLEPVSEDLRNLRAKEDSELHSYQYLDRAAGVVRIPIHRAMDLLAKEAAENRLPYSTRPTPVKPPEPAQGAPDAKK